MRLLLSINLILGILAISLSQTIAIENVNIVDVQSGKIISNQHVLLEKDLIKKISSTVFKNADHKIDATGKYLMPGLWDMHVHLSNIGEESIPLFVASGVTGVRDMGGNWTKLKAWREYSDRADQTTFPKIKTAGPILESAHFYGMLSKILGEEFGNTRIPLKNIADVEATVDSVANLGVDFIKIRTAVSEEVFLEVLRSSQNHRLPVTGHIDQSISIEKAVKNGIATIEHDLFLQVLALDEDERKSILATIVEYKPFFTPTLLATYQSRIRPASELKMLINDSTNKQYSKRKYLSPVLIENWKIEKKISLLEAPMPWDSIINTSRSFASSIAEDTDLLGGTDVGVAGIYPGWGLHEELQMMVNKLNVSPLKAIQAATLNAANSLGLLDQYGSVSEGKKADILLLTENPLADISNIQSIEIIFKNGVPITQAKREAMLSKVEGEVSNRYKDYVEKNLQHLNNVLKSMGM